MDAHFTSGESVPDGVTPEEYKVMLTYLQILNRSYFGGDLRELEGLDPDGSIAALWEQTGDLTALYYRSVQKEFGNVFTIWDYPN